MQDARRAVAGRASGEPQCAEAWRAILRYRSDRTFSEYNSWLPGWRL